jgi:anti-anti-sigma factor
MLNVKVEELQQNRIMRVAGDIGLDEAERFRSELLRAAGQATGMVTIDASAIGYIHASALSALLELHAAVRDHGGQLQILKPAPRLRGLLAVTELTRVLAVVESPC